MRLVCSFQIASILLAFPTTMVEAQALAPAADGSAGGTIRFAWGTRSFTVPWRVR
jgi:hypothetical protein